MPFDCEEFVSFYPFFSFSENRTLRISLLFDMTVRTAFVFAVHK
jgi:hypothetical protein